MAGYATTLPLPTADVTEVLQHVGSWIRTKVPVVPPNIIGTELTTSRVMHQGDGGHSVAVDTAVVQDRGLLVDVEWTHPGGPYHQYRIELTVAALPQTAVTIRGQVRDTRLRLAPVTAAFAPPRLVTELLNRYPVDDAGLPVGCDPILIGAADARALPAQLFSADRTLPVVHLSYNRERGEPLIDPHRLARDLVGVAHVTYTQFALPDLTLRDQLGPMGAWGGAVRTWWPGLTADDETWKHPLHTAGALADWRGRPLHVQLVTQLRQMAMDSPLTNPPLHREVRREARRALRSEPVGHDTAAMTERIELLTDEVASLEEEVLAWGSIAEQAEAQRLEAERAQEDAEARLATAEANLQAVWSVDVASTQQAKEDNDPTSVEEPTSVAEAVAMAAEYASKDQALRILKSARSSAKASPYRRPGEIYDALATLAEVAREMRRPGGLGRFPRDRGSELGLDWVASGPGARSLGGPTARLYTFNDAEAGTKWTPDNHLRLGGGSGASLTARIYFCIDADRDDGAQMVILHVGEHLPDSTTG